MNAAPHTLVDYEVAGHPANASTREAFAAVCPLCRSTSSAHAFSDGGCELRVCNNCELFFVHPYPRAPEQHQRVSSGEYPGIELLDCARRYQGERFYYDRHFGPIAEETGGATSILDVGCGTGNLLERFAALPKCYRLGIELNPAAAHLARRVAGCEILELPFEEFRGDRRFDAITMVSVFSHVSSFDGMFGSLRRALAPGGRVIMRTTEMSRRVSRWNQAHWGIPDDLHFLGLNTLGYLCAKYGFTIARHVRVPFEQELFQKSRWQQMGRSRWHNALKRAAVRIPGSLPAMQKFYAAALGQRLFVSFIVLKADSASGSDGKSFANR
ncbi:MAG TPA: class I SAM-dependent methyltransferase [Candidatus Dormibacteraeota bacterium]|nr:class I SAM-dependent methyltransferase [Candidatus Dormibacteraeota bacterium]